MSTRHPRAEQEQSSVANQPDLLPLWASSCADCGVWIVFFLIGVEVARSVGRPANASFFLPHTTPGEKKFEKYNPHLADGSVNTEVPLMNLFHPRSD